MTATNTATSVVLTTKTNEAGQYQFSGLPPGVYTVKAAAKGFTTQVVNGVQIDVQSRPSIDFALKIGQIIEVVEVRETTLLLQSQSADVGGVVQEQQIKSRNTKLLFTRRRGQQFRIDKSPGRFHANRAAAT